MKKMQTWVALTALGVVAIVAGGWFLLVSPKKSHAAELRAEADTKSRANMLLENRLQSLKADAKNLPAQQAKLAAVAAKIPNSSAMPALVRALNKAADDTGVELVSITPTAPVVVASTAPVAGTPTVATPSTSSTSTTGTKGAATAAAPSAAGAAAVGQLYQIPVSLNVVGSYFQVAEYLDRLESLQRAFRVSTFSLTPGQNPVKSAAAQPTTDSGKVLTGTISGFVFQTQGGTVSAAATGK